MYNKMTGKIGEVVGVLLVLTSMVLVSCSDEPISPKKYGTISGRVLDASDDSPVEGVSITTTPSTVSATTDKTGAYTIDQVESGSYTVRASRQGYKNAFTSVIVHEGE